MKEVFDFLVENHKLMIQILTLVFEAIVFLVLLAKKKVNPSISGIVAQLPALVGIAEEKFGAGKGADKKAYVLACASALFTKATGQVLSESSGIYKTFANAVEEILSTPQRKEK